ncbi:MAG: hypothetical protein U0929_14065, partial [Planctomycetaceae bacterium]
TDNQRSRSGLAPLELVLVLPLMMMVAGLMLFVANAAVWKLRSHGAAREAAFQQFYPRTGEISKPPPDWVRPDVATTVLAGPPVWSSDPFEMHELFRGPSWRTLPIDGTRLDGSTGLWTGRAQSNIKSELWPQMKVYYRFQRDVTVLGSQQWQFQAMGMRHHGDRRSKTLMGIGE